MKRLILFSFFLFFTIVLAACSSQENDMGSMDHSGSNDNAKQSSTNSEDQSDGVKTVDTETLTGNEFTITAKEGIHQLTPTTSVNALTFNGSVPGSQLRVKQGEKVKINLKNELNVPVTIHWHGITVPNDMDGIPGVTQNAVQPGETFQYEFTPEDAGTYMYHTHQNAVEQMDKGLYGSLIVEPKEVSYDRDYTLMLDEWISEEKNSGMDEMEGMDHEKMNSEGGQNEDSEKMENDEGNSMGHDMSEYDVFSINGKSGEVIEPLKVKEGEKVRLRLVNVGFMSHKIHLHGHDYKVVAIDGQEITNPQKLKDEVVSIAPGERYDIEFTADNPGEWFLECHGEMEGTKGMKTLIKYEGAETSVDKSNQAQKLPEFNFTSYGEPEETKFSLDQQYDVEYTMDLNTAMNHQGMAYTINDKTFPNTENIKVNENDLVKVTLTNNSKSDDHPMHLHGHFFQVLSKNGKPIEGSPIWKDTINFKPGDEYVVAFKADNPGNWLFHCHDLHHASAGMVNMVKYNGFTPNFTPDPEANNQPE
ncbi:multicopper oxidase family protein [Rossellomorea aquimaris]|uniref:multicopper oxidase family protein n=1 Tax=Rossellomorea aquimaris TaxID=189382 RepID=UPI0037C6433D